MTPPVVIHVPHSSTVIPDEIRRTLAITDAELTDELLRMTDHFTHELFEIAPSEAVPVIAPVSRLVVDVERFPSDEDEPMAAAGMGVVYMKTSRGGVLRTSASRGSLVTSYYEPHHATLARAVQAAIDAHGRCLIIDAHSFSSVPLPHEPDQDPDRPDICIGTDSFHTPPELRDRAVEAVDAVGWTVAIDRPFAGCLVPLEFYGADSRVQSIMIEVNRRLYMGEHTGERLPTFDVVRASIGALVRSLAGSAGTPG